jgi:hypothetical protein
MNLLNISSIIDSVGKVAGDLITTDKEKMQLEIENRKLDQAIDIAQIQVNKEEAKSSSLFVSGWRPAVGWIGAAALAYQFLLYPILGWAWKWLQAMNYVPAEMSPPPLLDAEQLWVMLSGILGIAGMRTFEKQKGVASK